MEEIFDKVRDAYWGYYNLVDDDKNIPITSKESTVKQLLEYEIEDKFKGFDRLIAHTYYKGLWSGLTGALD